MKIGKLHDRFSKALSRMTCHDERPPTRMVEPVMDCLRELDPDDFPEYLRREYRELTDVLSHGDSSPGVHRGEARELVEAFTRLFCEVETHRCADDPGRRFFVVRGGTSSSPGVDWTKEWTRSAGASE